MHFLKKSFLLFSLLLPSFSYPLLNEWSDFNERMRKELLAPIFSKSDATNKKRSPNRLNEEDDVHGEYPPTLDDIKGPIPQPLRDLCDYINDPSSFDRAGAKLPTGILLWGKPGTGKTSLARAFAAQVQVPFFSAKASEFIEIYIGTGAKKIRELFDKVRTKLKKSNARFAVLFIDELDAIGTRNSHVSNSEETRTITELLAQMDGFAKERNIIVIGATNRPDLIDPALLRPGRFEEIIEIPLPDTPTRLAILRHYVYAPQFHRSVEQTIDLAAYATLSDGFTGADLESMVNQAALLAARSKSSMITKDHFEQAFKHVRLGTIKR